MEVLVCLPVEGSGGYYIVPGSIKKTCADCFAAVYVAPSGQQILEGKLVLCLPCGAQRIKADPDPKFRIAEGVKEEVDEWKRRN